VGEIFWAIFTQTGRVPKNGGCSAESVSLTQALTQPGRCPILARVAGKADGVRVTTLTNIIGTAGSPILQ